MLPYGPATPLVVPHHDAVCQRELAHDSFKNKPVPHNPWTLSFASPIGYSVTSYSLLQRQCTRWDDVILAGLVSYHRSTLRHVVGPSSNLSRSFLPARSQSDTTQPKWISPRKRSAGAFFAPGESGDFVSFIHLLSLPIEPISRRLSPLIH